jgi:hypothetical protein
VSGIERTKEELNRNEPARVPIDNEIPDSVNVQANLAPGANVPGAVENEHESRQQLNLGIRLLNLFEFVLTLLFQ